MTTKPTWPTLVHLPNHPVAIEDPLKLLPRSLTKLHSIWVSLPYPFASKGHNLSIHYTCDSLTSKAHRIKSKWCAKPVLPYRYCYPGVTKDGADAPARDGEARLLKKFLERLPLVWREYLGKQIFGRPRRFIWPRVERPWMTA